MAVFAGITSRGLIMSETHEAMGLPDTTKLDDVSGDTTPMEEHLSTSDKEHTSDSRYQH